MKRKDQPRSGMKTSTGGRRLATKVVAWTLAVPALCAAVVVCGAVPFYLFLPDAPPTGPAAVETVQAGASAPRQVLPPSPPPADARRSAAVAPATRDAIEDVPTEGTPVEAVPEEEAPDEMAIAPTETIAATVIPTPRPIPAATSAPPPPTVDTPRETAAVETVPPRNETAEKARAPRSGSDRPLQGRRMVVRTAAKLRAAPQGAEIGVVREGTELVVGRCDRWCEVSADGRRGFVHASLIDGGPTRNLDRRAERSDWRRPATRRLAEERWIDERGDLDERPRYERRDYHRRLYERAYRRGEDPDWLMDDRDAPMDGPDWYVEDERPIVRGGPPALLYYEPYR